MTNEDLQSLGEMLRQARETQALSLQEVEAQTRIRVKFLQALEDGDLGVLPSATHTRGFLRNYAQFLRLDVEDIVARFVAATGVGVRPVTQLITQPSAAEPAPPAPEPETEAPSAKVVEEEAPAEAPLPGGEELGEEQAAEQGEPQPSAASPPDSAEPPPDSEATRPPRPTYVPAAQRAGPGRPRTYTPPAAPVAGVPQATPAQEAAQPTTQRTTVSRVLRSNLFTLTVLALGLIAIVWWVTTRLSAISGDELVPVAPGADVMERFGDAATLTPSPTFRPTSTPEPQTGPEFLDRVVLSITVTQRTWTQVEVDGEAVFEGMNEPGEVLRYEGVEEIFIRTGNAAALNVNYNGQDIGPMGERGEVVERFFTVGGQITPTPTPTITPTNTGVPTPTPRPTATPEP